MEERLVEVVIDISVLDALTLLINEHDLALDIFHALTIYGDYEPHDCTFKIELKKKEILLEFWYIFSISHGSALTIT